MTENKNDTHRHDPRWIIAKSPGIDAHGRRFGKGAQGAFAIENSAKIEMKY
jgi:hypothetical protein